MTDSTKVPYDQMQSDHAFDWMSDHGQISYRQLMRIAQSDSPEALEKLHEIADDNNVSYDESTDPVQLAEQISSKIESDSNTGVE